MRLFVPVAVLALTVSACGSSSPETLALEAEPSAVSVVSEGSVEEFCDVMTTLSTNAPTDPPQLYALYDEALRTAPVEVEADATEFVRLSRALSELVEPLVDTPDQIPNALAGADPELLEFVTELQSSAATGVAGDTPTGRLLTWYAETCEG